METYLYRALSIVAKKPAPGAAKTRLSPPLSARQASQLYECFLRDTLDLVRQVAGVSRLVAYTPAEEAEYFRALAPDFDLVPQVGADLGERLDSVLTHCLSVGFHQAVVLGSDCPTLPVAYLSAAFDLLGGADVVLGPAEDGGYYLIGVERPQSALLRQVPMSTPRVLEDTLALAQRQGISVALLPRWYDVDTARDLARLRADLVATPGLSARHTRDFLRRLG